MALKRNGKHTESYKIRGRPEVYDDLVEVLRLSRKFGAGTEVVRVHDDEVMAIVPSSAPKAKASLED